MKGADRRRGKTSVSFAKVNSLKFSECKKDKQGLHFQTPLYVCSK